MPSLTFPLPVQHAVLSHVQQILEHICERFGKRWCPSLMESRGWTQSKSLELNCWVGALLKNFNTLPEGAFAAVEGRETKGVLRAVVKIRHWAVHRCSQSAQSILETLKVAKDFTYMHQDGPSSDHLSTLEAELRVVVNKLDLRRSTVEEELSQRLRKIAEEKAVLETEATRKAQTQIDRLISEAGEAVMTIVAKEASKIYFNRASQRAFRRF